MGNMCVGGSSTAVYQPGLRDEHDEDTRLSDLTNSLNNLVQNQGVSSAQHNYLTNQASPQLRSSHDRLFRNTTEMINLASIDHAHISGHGAINAGIPTTQIVASLNDISSRWADMRETIQTAMDTNVSGDEDTNVSGAGGNVIQNPSGSMRWGHLQN